MYSSRVFDVLGEPYLGLALLPISRIGALTLVITTTHITTISSNMLENKAFTIIGEEAFGLLVW